MYAGRPYIRYLPHVRCAAKSPRGKYVSVESLGRSSLMGGGSLFPHGACGLLPFRPHALPRFFLAPAAHARPNALTLNPSGFVLPAVAFAPPLFPLRLRPSILRFPSPCGLPAVARATLGRPLAGSLRSPAPRSQPCGDYVSADYRGCFRRGAIATLRRSTTTGCAGRAVRSAGEGI